MNTSMTNVEKLHQALVVEGRALTPKQIASWFKIANPRAEIYRLRNAGYPIFLNTKTDDQGRTTRWYRYGKASRSLVAAGYAYLAMQKQGLV